MLLSNLHSDGFKNNHHDNNLGMLDSKGFESERHVENIREIGKDTTFEGRVDWMTPPTSLRPPLDVPSKPPI